MQRPYSFLIAGGLSQMPNPQNLPVFLVRRKGDADYEKQPARSVEEAVRKFVNYASVKSGIVEALRPDQDLTRDRPFTYEIKGKHRGLIK